LDRAKRQSTEIPETFLPWIIESLNPLKQGCNPFMEQGFHAALAARRESLLQGYRESRSQGRTMPKEILTLKLFCGPQIKLDKFSRP
jgi:hypothetical protein